MKNESIRRKKCFRSTVAQGKSQARDGGGAYANCMAGRVVTQLVFGALHVVPQLFGSQLQILGRVALQSRGPLAPIAAGVTGK